MGWAFLFCLFVEILGEREDLQIEVLRGQQFRIIGPRVHSQNHRIKVGRNSRGIPAHTFRQQPGSSQATTGRLKDLVI